MGPDEFLRDLAENGPAPAYLFLGAEGYRRAVCRRELVQRALPEGERESGLVRHDLEEIPLAEIVDDARSLSLFAPRRLIWACSAEAALPRGRGSASDSPGLSALADYLRDPAPGVVLVFEASRYEYQGEGKKKLERVAKFYSPIPPRHVVAFPPYTPVEAQRLARQLAREAKLKVGPAELGLLAEAVGYEGLRIAQEIEKLRLFAGAGGEITAAEIARLVPSARAATVFELVAALGRGDRRRALETLDTLVQHGEYLPLALSFLGAQFRHALVAKEMGLRTPGQIQAEFAKSGIRIWFRKAQEIHQTAAAFSAAELQAAIGKVYRADKALREARPDDRTVMEELVLGVGKK